MIMLITDLERTYRGFYVHLIAHPDDWICRGELADFLEDHTGESIADIACCVLSSGQRWQVSEEKRPSIESDIVSNSRGRRNRWYWRNRRGPEETCSTISHTLFHLLPANLVVETWGIYKDFDELYTAEQAIALALKKQGAS